MLLGADIKRATFYFNYFTQTFCIQPILKQTAGQILNLILAVELEGLATPGLTVR